MTEYMSQNLEPLFQSDSSFAKEFRDKVRLIHEHFDKDQDGYLNFKELSNLQFYTSGSTVDSNSYGHLCKIFGTDPNQGLSLDHLRLTYSSVGANIDDDFAKVFEESRRNIRMDQADGVFEVGEGGVDISPSD